MSARDAVLVGMQADISPPWTKTMRADAILSALSAAGYAVVPTEPTEAMCKAARDRTEMGGIADLYFSIYRAMIDSINAATDRDIERAALKPTR